MPGRRIDCRCQTFRKLICETKEIVSAMKDEPDITDAMIAVTMAHERFCQADTLADFALQHGDDADAARIVLDGFRDAWDAAGFSLKSIAARLLVAADRGLREMNENPKPRNDDPTPAQISFAREVLAKMLTRNPDVVAWRNAARTMGMKGSKRKRP
jgi:hypothetical protein